MEKIADNGGFGPVDIVAGIAGEISAVAAMGGFDKPDVGIREELGTGGRGEADEGVVLRVKDECGDGDGVKDAGGGWFQSIELPTPAVLTIQSGGNKLRYATLMGIKRAKTKELRFVTAAELAVDAAPVVVLERVTLPRKQKSTQMLPGTAKEATAALVEKLNFEARLL